MSDATVFRCAAAPHVSFQLATFFNTSGSESPKKGGAPQSRIYLVVFFWPTHSAHVRLGGKGVVFKLPSCLLLSARQSCRMSRQFEFKLENYPKLACSTPCLHSNVGVVFSSSIRVMTMFFACSITSPNRKGKTNVCTNVETNFLPRLQHFRSEPRLKITVCNLC